MRKPDAPAAAGVGARGDAALVEGGALPHTDQAAAAAPAARLQGAWRAGVLDVDADHAGAGCEGDGDRGVGPAALNRSARGLQVGRARLWG
ncbi:hypothetical protein [Streptomyces sp. NPDC050704]|uniref:hypothetical protein n=1 Tax=Streptomyces sp. NPDC050704 TaxID=3157219 RepID=UPI003413F7CF